MSSPYVVSALTCAGALSANSIAVTTTLSTTGAVTATGGLTSFLLASSSTNLTLRTPAGFSIVAGGASATQAAGQATVLVVGQPGTGTDLFYVTAAGSGSGSSTVVSTVPTTVSNTLNVTGASTLAAITGTTLGLSSTLSVPAVSTLGTANITTLGVSGVSTLAAVNCAAVTATSSGTVLVAQSSSTTSVIMASLLASSANSGQGQTLQLGRTSTTGNVFEITTYMQGDNNSGSAVYFNYKDRDQHFILRNDTVRTTQYYGEVIVPYVRATSAAVVDGQGGYMSWNDGSDGITYFNNQLGSGTGGWKFRPYTSGNVASAAVMTLTQAGSLSVAAIDGTNFTPQFYYWSPGTGRREFGVTNPGSTRTGTLTGVYRKIGNLVTIYIYMNLDILDNAPALLSTGWVGGFPKFGMTIIKDSITCATLDPGQQNWPGITNPNHCVASVYDTQNSINSPDDDSVCFYADTTVLKVTTLTVVPVTYSVRFSLSYMLN